MRIEEEISIIADHDAFMAQLIDMIVLVRVRSHPYLVAGWKIKEDATVTVNHDGKAIVHMTLSENEGMIPCEEYLRQMENPIDP